MRLLSFVAPFATFWVPIAVALLMIGRASYLGNVGMGVLGATFGLVIGLCKVAMRGARAEKKEVRK